MQTLQMQTLRRTALVLIWPAIACLGAACDRMDGPTEPELPEAVLSSGGSGTLWVNDDAPALPPGNGCPRPDYNSIQAAVTAAQPGDHINVCPGTYLEQVTIPDGKDRLRLKSVRRWEAVIKAPPVMADPKAIVRVNAAREVTILAFTITGPGGGPCNSLRYGVRVDDGGSADILGNHIIDIRDNPFSGCQNGVAVQVGRRTDPADPNPDVTVGTAKVMGNVIERYQKNGPTVSNNGSYAEIAHNRILGIGSTAIIAQNGVQASSGAAALIRHNFVYGHLYAPQTFASTGILLFQSGKVQTDHNTVTTNDVGVYMFEAAPSTTTEHNRVRASTFDGVTLDQATGNQVAYNKSEENSGPGIALYDSDNNGVDNNHVEDNRESGILLGFGVAFPAIDNMIGNNQVRNNGTEDGDMHDGIRINANSIGNNVHNNHLRDNVTHDCHDNNAPGLNTWVRNHGETSFPSGLCDRENDDAAFESSTVYGWDPNYPWSTALDIPADYDWAAAYATVDTESLLQLLPAVSLNGAGRRPTNPIR